MSSFGSKKAIVHVSTPWKLAIGGAGSLSAVALLHPVDVMKIRMQMQGQALKAGGKRLGIGGMALNVFKNEGMKAFLKGLSAASMRQIVYSSIRYGTYPIFKEMLSKEGEFLPLWKKLVCSVGAGAVGAFCGSPNDLIMVRMQSGNTRGYKNVFHGMYKTVREDGVFGLWRGANPTVLRGAVVTAGQIASYDQIKQLLMTKTKLFAQDNLFTHLTASSLAGIISTIATNPVDVIKTRVMAMKPNAAGELPYKGVVDCAVKMFRTEGIRGFFSGVIPSGCRLVPVTIGTFLFYEQYFSLYLYAFHRDVFNQRRADKKAKKAAKRAAKLAKKK